MNLNKLNNFFFIKILRINYTLYYNEEGEFLGLNQKLSINKKMIYFYDLKKKIIKTHKNEIYLKFVIIVSMNEFYSNNFSYYKKKYETFFC